MSGTRLRGLAPQQQPAPGPVRRRIWFRELGLFDPTISLLRFHHQAWRGLTLAPNHPRPLPETQIYAFRPALQAVEASHPPVKPVLRPMRKMIAEAGLRFKVAVSRR